MVVVRVPIVKPEDQSNVFQHEIAIHTDYLEYFIGKRTVIYYGENISVSFWEGASLHEHKFENIDALYKISRSMVS